MKRWGWGHGVVTVPQLESTTDVDLAPMEQQSLPPSPGPRLQQIVHALPAPSLPACSSVLAKHEAGARVRGRRCAVPASSAALVVAAAAAGNSVPAQQHLIVSSRLLRAHLLADPPAAGAAAQRGWGSSTALLTPQQTSRSDATCAAATSLWCTAFPEDHIIPHFLLQ